MKNNKNTVLVTGAAGFIGFNLIMQMDDMDVNIIGIDNFNDYYNVNLKESRAKILKDERNIEVRKMDICDKENLEELCETCKPNYIIHLAAQAGVRYSINNPSAYIDSNVVGFLNILEVSRKYKIKHLIYASSSSVYGGNKKVPFSTVDRVDHPVSLYAATKKSNELMAHAYSHLYDIPTTGLRFFTVYGPWGRPDMAYFKFTKRILEGASIDVYNYGEMERDFTFIDDVVVAIKKLIYRLPDKKEVLSIVDDSINNSFAPYVVYNVGNNRPVSLNRFIEAIEKATGQSAKKNLMPIQPGDVVRTFADITDLEREIDFKPITSIEEGIEKFVEWYLKYHNQD